MIDNINNGEDGLSVRNKLNSVIGVVNTPIVNNPVDNHLVTSNGTTGTIDSETNITFNGTTLDVTGNIVADKIGVDINVMPVLGVGEIGWNDTDGTLEFVMKGGNVTQQIGQEINILVKHADNEGLNEGRAVYVTGSDGSNLKVRYASSTSELTSVTTIGLMTEGSTGANKAFCTTFGLVRGLNTNFLLEGAPVYVDGSGNGVLTSVKPTAPQHSIYMGICLRSNINNGVIFVNVQTAYELNELHDVKYYDPLTLANGSMLKWNSTSKYWETMAAITNGSSGTSGSVGATGATGPSGSSGTSGVSGGGSGGGLVAGSGVYSIITDSSLTDPLNISTATQDYSIAIGSGATITGTLGNGVAIGHNAKLFEAGGVAIGSSINQTTTFNYRSIGIGTNVRASAVDTIAIGVNCETGGESGGDRIAIGSQAVSRSDGAVALGAYSFTAASNAVALGANTNALTPNTVTLRRLQMQDWASIGFLDDAAAEAGGIPLGGLYHSSGIIQIRIT